MAEYGAHHATYCQPKASIFEILGQESLVIALRGSFRHIFKVLAENNPERYGLLFKYFDEGYTVVDTIFQYVHLRLRGGLFTETFYGLKRLPDPRTFAVSKKKVAVWVILAVIYPYVRLQLLQLYKNIREKMSEGSLNYKDIRQNLAPLYLKIYPVYNFVLELTILSYYMAYAVGKTDFHSPLFHLTSTKLIPLTLDDLAEDAWKRNIPNHQHRNFSTVMWNWINGFVSGITLTISVGAFVTQFLDWWYSRDEYSSSLASLPVPPPPRKWPYDLPADICPLCKKKRTNDTVLGSSGFVYCYPCVFRYVQENSRCPVTGYPSSLNQLVKLYHQE